MNKLGDGGHSAVLRTLPLSGSANKHVSGSGSESSPKSLSTTSDTRRLWTKSLGGD